MTGVWQTNQEQKKENKASCKFKQIKPRSMPKVKWLPKVLTALQVIPAIFQIYVL